jgi:magnesium transporter
VLVNCAAYEQGRKIADIPREAISDYLGRPDCFVWVALKDPTPAELEEMRHEFGLHELAVEDAHHGHQRPKIEEYGTSLFAVLQSLEIRDGEMHQGEIDIFVGPNYILTVRQDTEPGFASVRARTEREPHLLRIGSGFVFYALVDHIVDRYFPVMDALEVKLEALEERIFSGDSPRANIQDIYRLKQQVTLLIHAIDPLLEAVAKLQGARVPAVSQGMQEYFRDVVDHLTRLSHQADTLGETIGTAMSVNLGMISLSENEVTKRLAAYAALFAVPTMIAGVYGMNFRFMPELEWMLGYPLILSIMIGADLYLFRRFRKAGWL